MGLSSVVNDVAEHTAWKVKFWWVGSCWCFCKTSIWCLEATPPEAAVEWGDLQISVCSAPWPRSQSVRTLQSPGLSQSCYTCFSDSRKYQNCKALNYNCRDAILSISDVTKVSWRSYLQKLFKSTCELEWKRHIFQNKNFHFNPRLKKVHVLVNGILQFTHFMPLGCFFFSILCALTTVYISERDLLLGKYMQTVSLCL